MIKIKDRMIRVMAACLLLCLGCTLLCGTIQGERVHAEEVTAEEFFTSSGAEILQNAPLPSYMQTVNRNGNVLQGSELTAVRIETDGERRSVTINYNRVIDLTECDRSLSLFEFLIAPANPMEYKTGSELVTQDMYEFRDLNVTFTDIYDPATYLSFNFNRDREGRTTMYMRASTQTQESMGWVANKGHMSGGSYGTILDSSFTGAPADAEGTYNVVSAAYDYAENCVYGSPYNKGQAFVRDLDDPKYLGEKDNLWQGFTTGEVTLSIEISQIYTATKAVMYIFSVNGQDLTGEKIVDTTPPSVNIDTASYGETLPLGEVGVPYSLFPATAYDRLDGKLPEGSIVRKVFYEYGTERESSVSVSNGTFTPDKAGTYSIVYEVSDSAGNIGRKVADVTVKTKLAQLVCSAPGYQAPESIQIGSVLTLPGSLEVKGGSGAYATEISVIECKTGEKVPADGNNVLIERKGYYEIICKAWDYIGKECYSKYLVKAEGREKPLVEEPSLPDVWIAGHSFKLPDFRALDYTTFDGYSAEAAKEYLISTDNWKTHKVYKAGDVIVPQAGDLLYKVRATNLSAAGTEYESESRTIRVISAQSIGDYFHDPSGAALLDYSDAEHPVYRTKTDTQLYFANKLGVRNLDMKFAVPEGAAAYGTLEFIFRDTEKANAQSVISVQRKNASACNILLNGKPVFELNTAFTDGTEFIVYSFGGKVYINGTYVCDFTDSEGKTLFDNGYAYFSVAIKDVSGEAAVKLIYLNNQTYVGLFDAGQNFDITPPTIMLEQELSSVYSVGDLICIPSAIATDVLDSDAEISVELRKNGNIEYIAGAGFAGYEFKAREPADYSVIYMASDSLGNSNRIEYKFKVYGGIRPSLTVNGTLATAADVGSSVRLPSASAKDYAGKELQVTVYVIAPDGVMTKQENSFVAEMQGIYKVRYVCTDSEYSYTVREYRVVAGG